MLEQRICMGIVEEVAKDSEQILSILSAEKRKKRKSDEEEGEEEEKEKEAKQQATEQGLDFSHIEQKEGEDSKLYYFTQLRLGTGLHYDESWRGDGEKSLGIPTKFWPLTLFNLLLNSPKAHHLIRSFLLKNGLVDWNWNADSGETKKTIKKNHASKLESKKEEEGEEEEEEEEEEEDESSLVLYENPLFFKEGDYWVGFESNIPTEGKVKNFKGSPRFCYGLKVNPNIHTETLMQERLTQAIVQSPDLDNMVDVPCLHYLFEYKWRSYGIFATSLMAFFYVLFLLCATPMALWVSDDDTNHSTYALTVAISAVILIFQVVVELKQVYGVLSGESTLVSKSSQLVDDYLLNFWNLVDALVIVMWLLVNVVASSSSPESRDVLCSIAIVIFWLKTLFFFRGIKAFSVLLEVLKIIIKDMVSFLVLLTMFLGAFAGAFRCLHLDNSTSFAFLRVFDMMFGDFSSSDMMNDSSVSWFSLILYLVFMLVTPLILLNAIIAVMGDSYDRAQENARTSYLASRMKLLAEYETIGFHRVRPLLYQVLGNSKELFNPYYRLSSTAKLLYLSLKGLLGSSEVKSDQDIQSQFSREHQQFKVPSTGKLLFYCLLLGPFWHFLLQKLADFALNEEGDLYVFIPEDNEDQVSAAKGEEDEAGNVGIASAESDWYGKLPRILSKIDRVEHVQSRLDRSFDGLKKTTNDTNMRIVEALLEIKEDMAAMKRDIDAMKQSSS
jgi:hypothetical protein